MFGVFKILKGLLIKEENTLTPRQISITPGGTADTETAIVSSQTVDRTITLPDATDTLVGKATTDVLTNKSIDADANTITNIENADIKAGAAIAKNKLAAGTANRVSVTDGSGFLVESTVTTADLDEIAGLAGLDIVTTAATQTLTNKTIDADLNTITNIENADIKAGAAIDATKLADGSVTNTELQYINSLTSNAQTQLDGKVDESLYAAKGSILAATAAATPANLPVGTDGQVLTADSAEATGVKWAPAGTTSPLTTKGDLYTYDTNNARLPVGTNGQILTADSAEATGLKWAAAPATGANTTLSNLTSPTAVNQDLLPDSDNTRDLGSSSARYAEVHTQKVQNTGSDLTLQASSSRIVVSANSVNFPQNSGDPSGMTQADTYYNSGLDKFKYHDGSLLRQIATKDENSFIPNGFAESSTTGFATYADAAGTAPVDGTGGSPNVTISVSSTNPLSGQNSFLMTKDAANRQGQGFSYDFTIDNASKAKVLQIQFDYLVNSGTFVAGGPTTDSDIVVYVYDITNSRLIQPTTYKLFSNSSTIPDHFISNFQSSADSTSYRLIFHVATTSASAYELKVDNVVVSPTTISYGTPITDWTDGGAITIGATITPPTKGTTTRDKIFWRRVGSGIEIDLQYYQSSAGSAGSGEYLISLPAGLQADTTVKPAFAASFGSVSTGGAPGEGQQSFLGLGSIGEGTSRGRFQGYLYNSTQIRFVAEIVYSTYDIWKSSSFAMSISGLGFSAKLFVPIAGWSAQVQSSDVNDQRIVAASYWVSSNFAASTTTPINFDSKDFDTHNAVTTSPTAWKFTAPISGVYRVFGSTYSATGSGAKLYKNGTAYKNMGGIAMTSNSVGAWNATIELKAGDYIDVRPLGALTVTGGTQSTDLVGNINVERIANPASITSTETVAAKYIDLSGVAQAFTSVAPFKPATKVIDTHNAFDSSTGRFTAPVAGLYFFSAALYVNTGSVFQTQLWKNGSFDTFLGYVNPGGVMFVGGNTIIQLNAGDYIDLRNDQGSGAIATAAVNRTFISVHKVGI